MTPEQRVACAEALAKEHERHDHVVPASERDRLSRALPHRIPFEAVAVRYVHDVRTEEFLNVGIVLVSRDHAFAGARFLSQWDRISAAFPCTISYSRDLRSQDS